MIPYGKQSISASDISSVVKVLKSDFITTGPKIEEFEKLVASFVGVKYAVAFNNGTSALLASCFAANIGKGDHVITSPYSFVATANCFVWFGAKPIFVDIDSKSFNINPKQIERSITGRTKAIITVDFAGNPCNYDKILALAKKHRLIVIDDASHAIGSKYGNKYIGSIADLTVFSFHPVKTITTGEGGMVLTNNHEYYDNLKHFRNHGIEKNKKSLEKFDGDWYYEMQSLGLNLRLTDFQAALGISQLSKIKIFIKKRRDIVQTYNEAFRSLPVVTPSENSVSLSAWHLYPIRLKLEELRVGRKIIFDELRKAGLGVQVHYIPVHLQPYYRKEFGFKDGDFPVSEAAYQSEISLPLFPKMTHTQINYVIITFKNVVKRYTK